MRAFLTLAATAFGALTVRILLVKHFSIDEFQYAHAAWLVAHGRIPYRDFFNDRFPLLYQTLGLIPPLKSATPPDILLLRWAMLPIVAITVALHALLNRPRGTSTALAGIVLLLATPAFTTRATEIRPDALAFMLFLAALVVLRSERLSDRAAAAVAGVLAGASLWASLKVIIYGCVFAIALIAKRRQLRDPLLFATGFALAACMILLYLAASGSLVDWFTWTVRWSWIHERSYPSFPRFVTALPFLRESWWIVLFGAVGWTDDLRRHPGELLLLLTFPATLLSFVIQRAPFEYSLIPFIGIGTLYASRAIVSLMSGATAVKAVTVVVIAYGLLSAAFASYRAAEPTNSVQLWTLDQLGRVTGATDSVYDNTGAYFARPAASYFYYTDEVLRSRLSATDIEESILKARAPAMLVDLRFRGLPPPLQAFLLEHYQSYAGDIRLWGMHFAGAGEFLAIESGSYFVEPPMPLEIDGRQVTMPVFSLTAGTHNVSGPRPFSILWLPRNGSMYVPGQTPRQSVFSYL